MKKQLLLLATLFVTFAINSVKAQVVVYSEDFNGVTAWTLNTDPVGEGAQPNQWYISCEEEGVGSGSCGEACGVGDQTLHISPNILLGDLGAAYAETGMGNTTTNRRAESGDINTVGDVDLTLSFDMIGAGGGTDFAEVFYSIDGGVSWVSLEAPLTSLCCGAVPCDGALQGLWETRTYLLPAACEGIPNLRISFVWQNVDDGIATDPSIGVDNLTITKPVVDVPGAPTALFDPEDITICQGETITYTDMSMSTDVISDWNWVFEGGAPGAAMGEGPHDVLYFTPGVYTTTLTVTDGIGSGDTSFTVTVLDASYAGESTAIDVCIDDIRDLNLVLGGADAGGTWTETSGIPSGGFDAATGELDATGLTAGDVYTFDYEAPPGVAPCDGVDVATVTVTIISCADLDAEFSVSAMEVCVGECITATNESTGDGITGYAWTFSDPAIPGPVTTEDPGEICFPNAGMIDVTLSITDGTTFDSETITINVAPLPEVNATASATTICEGGSVTLTGTGDALGYTWSGGVMDGVSFTLDETTTFTVTGVNNFDCENTDEITITVIPCEPLLAGFTFDNIVCVGDCITFTDTSNGNPVSWLWDFGGGGEPGTSTEQNPVICFNTPGIFDIQLTATNALGESSSTTNSITVFSSPTVEAEKDTVIELAGVAALIAVGSIPEGDYIWTPDDYVECEDCPITSTRPAEDIVYTVTLTDINGCTATDSVRVFVNFVEAIGVPDAFSPNGDGNNDVLFVEGLGLESVTFTVYNKYGERVFESLTQDIGWDGTYRGRDENPGVFTWVLEYQFLNGKSGVLKGNTTLVR